MPIVPLVPCAPSDGSGAQVPVKEYYIYDGQHIAFSFLDPDGPGAQTPILKHRYLHGAAVDQILADEVVASTTAPGNVLWPLTDNLGTVRDVVDFNETTNVSQVANHLTYDSFGRITAETNAAVDFLFAYTGRERDEETGLYYYRARYYDPATGRFLNQDPIGFEAGDANLYRYVENGPTNDVDPSGLKTERIVGIDEVERRIQAYLKTGTFTAFMSSEYAKDLLVNAGGPNDTAWDHRRYRHTWDHVPRPPYYYGPFRIVEDEWDVTSECGRKSNIAVVEFGGHATLSPYDTIKIGDVRTHPETAIAPQNAARFGKMIKEKVFHGKEGGLIILMFCFTGTYTKQDSPGSAKSIAQIIANESRSSVLTPSGYNLGSFAQLYGEPKQSRGLCQPPQSLDRHPRTGQTNYELNFRLQGVAHTSEADVWYLTTPE